MRILFTFVGGIGHFEPLAPIAHAAVCAGHTVAFCARPGAISHVESAGFIAFATSEPSGSPVNRLPLLAPDLKRENQVLRDYFARQTARQRARDIIMLCGRWQPDLIVCDEIDFGSMIAAEFLKLPYASVLVIASGSFVRESVVAEPLNEVRAEYGLPPDQHLEALSRYLVLSSFPHRFRDSECPLPATAHSFRMDIAVPQDQWPLLRRLLPTEMVYFTLGTVFDRESGDLFARVIHGLQELPINLVVTIGNYLDPAEFGSQLPNVHIERYIPQSMILPYASLVVSHGGSGSVIGALKYGLPSVLLPMGADQPLNALRCNALGIGLSLDVISATSEDIRNAVSKVLAEPSYRREAERMRDEMMVLPSIDYVLGLLELLGKEKRPLYSS